MNRQGTLQAFRLTDIIMNNQFSTWLHTPSQALTQILRRRSMKLVKNFVFAVLLVSVIAVNAFAGEHRHPWLRISTTSAVPRVLPMKIFQLTVPILIRLEKLRLIRQITFYTRRWQPFYQCTEKRTPKTNHDRLRCRVDSRPAGFVCLDSPINVLKSFAWEAVTCCIVPPSGRSGNRNFTIYTAKAGGDPAAIPYFGAFSSLILPS